VADQVLGRVAMAAALSLQIDGSEIVPTMPGPFMWSWNWKTRPGQIGNAVALGEPHQAAFVADQALVDVVELLDQRVDARLIEP